jgi:hypothetical protein
VGTWFHMLPKKAHEVAPGEVVREVVFQLRPSVGTWFHMMPEKAQEVAPGEVVREVAFQLRPSVGTWFTPLPQKVLAVAPKVEEPEKSTASAPVPFQLRPSVGTWFTPRPQKVQAVAPKGEEPEKSTASAPVPLQAEALRGHLVHAPAAECSGGRPEGGGAGEEHCPRQLAFQLRPAVGTWYAPVQKVQRAQAAPMPTIELPIAAKESPCFPLSPMWRSWPTRPKGAAARAREEADPLSPSARRSRSIPRASSPREDVMIRKLMIL